jgi:hypothetical protein
LECGPSLLLRIGRMTDDFTFNQVNDFFGNVGGMIRQSLRLP